MKNRWLLLLMSVLWMLPALVSAGGNQAVVRALAWDQAGEWLAVGWRDARIELLRPEDTSGDTPLSLTLDAPAVSIAWHPVDPAQLAVTLGSGSAVLLERGAEALDVIATLPSGYGDDPRAYETAWSADGRWLAVLHLFAGIEIWDAAAGTLHAELPLADVLVDMAWSPQDAAHLLIAQWNADDGAALLLWDIGEMQPVWQVDEPGSLPMHVAWHPDGVSFASAQSGGFDPEALVRIHDAADGAVVEQFSAAALIEPAVTWAPLDRLLLSECALSDGMLMLEVWRDDAVEAFTIEASDCTFALSPQDDLAYGNGALAIMSLDLP